MASIDDVVSSLVEKLGPICCQIEDHGVMGAEPWVAEHHGEEETRGLLLIALALGMQTKHERGEALPIGIRP
jgi:hypothetical protein